MIRRHEFNSQWWGADVGVLDDAAFFALPARERAAALKPWAWVEHKAPLSADACARAAAAGFHQTDTQLAFRIGLRRIPSSESAQRLEARFADEHPFEVEARELADFRHERFAALPGVTMERINERYALWSRRLLAADPGWCLELSQAGQVQGWFLAGAAEHGLHLTLAMLRRGARMSGHTLYQRALLEFAGRGAAVGMAEFSATNVAVHNIYASLGARFLAPAGCWMWWPEGEG